MGRSRNGCRAETDLAGGADEMLALKKQTDGKILVVVYREDRERRFHHHRVFDAPRSLAQPEKTIMAVAEINKF